MSGTSARCRLTVWVTPNARRSEVSGLAENMLRVRLQAPPIDGKANEALVRFLAETLQLSRSTVSIVAGHTGRRKIVEISDSGLSNAQLVEVLLASGSA